MAEVEDWSGAADGATFNIFRETEHCLAAAIHTKDGTVAVEIFDEGPIFLETVREGRSATP